MVNITLKLITLKISKILLISHVWLLTNSHQNRSSRAEVMTAKVVFCWVLPPFLYYTWGPFHKAGSTNSESNPELWVDLLWERKHWVYGSRNADLS